MSSKMNGNKQNTLTPKTVPSPNKDHSKQNTPSIQEIGASLNQGVLKEKNSVVNKGQKNISQKRRDSPAPVVCKNIDNASSGKQNEKYKTQTQLGNTKLSKITEEGEECEQSEGFANEIHQFYKTMPLTTQKDKKVTDISKNLIQRVCNFLSFRSKPQLNAMQIRLLTINKIKISGKKQEWGLLLSIYSKLTCQFPAKRGSHWARIGLRQDPMQQLKDTGILTLIQWSSFTYNHYEQSLTVFNFFIEMGYSLFLFHEYVTQCLCQFLQIKIGVCAKWEESQRIYDGAAIDSLKMIKGEVMKKGIEQIGGIVNKYVRQTVKKWIEDGKRDQQNLKQEDGSAQQTAINTNIEMFQIDDFEHEPPLISKKQSSLSLFSPEQKYADTAKMNIGQKHDHVV